MKPTGALVSILLLGGCLGWTVKSETSSNATPFTHYQTYDWTTPAGASVDRLVDQRIRDQVTAQLAGRGIHPVSPGQKPDFLVDYTVRTGPRIQTVVNGGYVGATVGASGATVIPPLPAAMTYVYTEQSLVLDFIDARSGRVFWRGYASYVVNRPADVSTLKTQQAVRKVLREYPASALARASRPSG